MQGCGAKLKKIRLEKGITLEEAHKKTKIHLDILKALEADSVVNLSPIYIKGFLKIYCNFLRVDPQDYISDYKESAATVKTVKVVEKEEPLESFIKAPSRKSIFPSPATTKKIIKIIFAILAACAAMPVKPRTPAIIATTKKINIQRTMGLPSLRH